jgi:hypothetical protein
MWLRTILIASAVLLCLYLSLCGGLYWAMLQPPDVFGRVMMKLPMATMEVLPFETLWMPARRGKLVPGDLAPDFRLPTVDHKETVQLSSFRGSRPVVLIFGSYT